MNAQTKIEPVSNVHTKLNEARQRFHSTKLEKTGWNDFSKYSYFELGDFLIPALGIFSELGLSASVSFTADIATMVIVDCESPADSITITSPMGSAKLKACHEVQNIGAVETYQRRYLWTAALEIVEHDALDATTGKKGAIESEAEQSGPSVNDEQITRLQGLLEATGISPVQFSQTMSCGKVSALPASKFDEAVDRLEKVLAKKAKKQSGNKAMENA